MTDHGERLYKIIRFRFNGPAETKETGLTLEQAQAHCRRDDTRGDLWFDGYDLMETADPSPDWKDTGRYPDMAEWIAPRAADVGRAAPISGRTYTYRQLRDVVRDFWDNGDVWGSTMGTWFSVCDVLSTDRYPIPAEWQFRPAVSPGMPIDGNVPIELYHALCFASLDDVFKLGTRLARLADSLERQGREY